MKIVSLLPSATEIICSLGLREHLVGVTHECDYPESVKGLPVVTQTLIPKGLSSGEIDAVVRSQLQTSNALYSLNMDVLEELQPDFIITQALCDVCAVAVDEVEAAACSLPGNPTVINLEPMSLADLYDTIVLVGEKTGYQQQSQHTVDQLKQRAATVVARSQNIPKADKPRVAFLEWIDPPFNAGHWTPEIIEMAGGIDCLGNKHAPSETTSWKKIAEVKPDLLFIALCGFNLERTQQDLALLADNPYWQQLPCVHTGELYMTDGNFYFSRPGPRLIDSLEIMAHTLHPNIHSLPDGLPAPIKIKLPL